MRRRRARRFIKKILQMGLNFPCCNDETDRVSGDQALVSVLREGKMCGEKRKKEVEQMERDRR